MSSLVLSDAQLQQFNAAGGSVALVDSQGRVVGIASPPSSLFTEADIAEAKHNLDTTTRFYTTAEMLAHLESLAPSGESP